MCSWGEYKIVCCRGHCLAYNQSGDFIMSGDTISEIINDLEEIAEGSAS